MLICRMCKAKEEEVGAIGMVVENKSEEIIPICNQCFEFASKDYTVLEVK